MILQCKEYFLAHTLSLDIDQPSIKSSSVFHSKIEREKDFPRTHFQQQRIKIDCRRMRQVFSWRMRQRYASMNNMQKVRKCVRYFSG